MLPDIHDFDRFAAQAKMLAQPTIQRRLDARDAGAAQVERHAVRLVMIDGGEDPLARCHAHEFMLTFGN